MDEGDEDREAGIGDEEDDGSDLDIGDPTNAGNLLQRNNFSSPVVCFLDVNLY